MNYESAFVTIENGQPVGRYANLCDYMHDARTPRLEKNRRIAENHSGSSDRSSWYGITSGGAAGCFKAAEQGWPQGATKLAGILDQINLPRLQSIRRRRVWSDLGDSLDVDRLYAGQLDVAWRRIKKAKCPTPPRVTIAVDAMAGAWIDSDVMFWRGGAAVVLADALVAAGYGVECVSVFRMGPFMPYGNGGDVQVRVKSFASPWSLSDAAATLALPGFFRAVGITWAATQCPVALDNKSSSIPNGIPRDYNQSNIDAPDSQHVLMVPQYVQNIESARDWINQQTAMLTAIAEEA